MKMLTSTEGKFQVVQILSFFQTESLFLFFALKQYDTFMKMYN